jgi:hypothetical protein
MMCRWEEQSYTVYNALINDFMKPRIQEVNRTRTRSQMMRFWD